MSVATAADTEVPRPADGLELIGEMAGSGYRAPPSLVRRADGQTIQLTKLLYLVLAAIDGRRTLDEIAAEVSTTYGRDVRADDIAKLVNAKLRPLGLLQLADGSAPEVKRSNPLLSLRLRYVVSDPARTRKITAPFAVLFFPLIIPLVVAGFVLVLAWALFDKGLASATHQAFDRPELLLTIFAISLVSAGFHEFGHAAAARYGGATPGAMGAGLYLIWPAFCTDVTDSYRLGRGGRLRTDLGGLYFNMIAALAMFGIWWVTRWDAFLLVIPAQVVQMIQQLTSLVRFDGYHVLADVTGVPDLYQRIKRRLLGLLPTRWHDPETKVLKPWARAVVTLWVVLVIPLIVAMMVLLVITMPRLLATAWKSLTDQWAMLTDAFGDGDVLGGLAKVLAILALVVPVVGMVIIVTRLVRKTTSKVWRATEGRPRRRVAAERRPSLLAALAFAWWPSSDNYRAVQAYERGAIGNVFRDVGGPPERLEEGAGGVVQTVAAPSLFASPDDAGGDAAALPTRDEPVLALVLVPTEQGDGAAPAPAWVFPFNRPLPPEEGDNQALAVNTTDGSVVDDVAFALVWVEDGSAVNVNEAYAFASCTDCTAVAIGFQVVLTIGQVDVVVPQNLAGAVNYACVRCVTVALANQLVITLPERPSDAALAELAALWEEIRAFGADLQDVPLSELRSRLTEYEQRIVDILNRDAESAAASTATATSTPTDTSPSPTSEPATATAPDDSSPAAQGGGDPDPQTTDDAGAAPANSQPQSENESEGDPDPTVASAPPATEAPDAAAPATDAEPVTSGTG